MGVQAGCRDIISTQTALVTGGARFAGHLAAILGEQAAVTVSDVSIPEFNTLPASINCIDADIRDQAALHEAVTSVDTVFHQATMVSVGDSIA
jgi:nucleoside-diphosphate-sugar epimerase